MDIGGVYRANNVLVKAWQGTPGYRRQVTAAAEGGTIPAMVRSPYSEFVGHYKDEFARLRGVVGERTLNEREALVAGCGSSAEEAILLLDNFPRLSRIHMVDWIPQHIDRLIMILRTWSQNDKRRDYSKIFVHLADLTNLAGFGPGAIDLFYARELFENADLRLTVNILREMRRVAANRPVTAGDTEAEKAVWFLLDYEPPSGIENYMAGIGLQRDINQPDIWRLTV